MTTSSGFVDLSPAALVQENPVWRSVIDRFESATLLGASELTAAYEVKSFNHQHPLLLVLSRRLWQGKELGHWRHQVMHIAKLQNPNWLPVQEVGHDLPFVLYNLEGLKPIASLDNAPSEMEILRQTQGLATALASAHDANIPHGDIQTYLIVSNGSELLLAGMSIAYDYAHSVRWAQNPVSQLHDPVLRNTMMRDNVQLGLFMYGWLNAEPALGIADLGAAASRLPPWGSTFLQPPAKSKVSPELRQILGRLLHHSVDQRYLSSRSIVRSIDALLQEQAEHDPQILDSVLSKASTYGILPIHPETYDRLQRLAGLRQCSAHDIEGVLLSDIGLAIELVRTSNSSLKHGGSLGLNDAVLSLHRTLQMRGLLGLAKIARTLELSPKSLSVDQMALMSQQFLLVRKAAHLAQLVCPAGYDTEAVYMVALLQNLGRLMICAHMPDEAVQIHHLIKRSVKTLERLQPVQPPPLLPFAQQACASVLGVDFDSFTRHTLRTWGLGTDVQSMANAIGSEQVSKQESNNDHQVIRLVASLANEVIALHTQSQALLNLWLPQIVAPHKAHWPIQLDELKIGLAKINLPGGDLPHVESYQRADVWSGQEIQEDLLDNWRPRG